MAYSAIEVREYAKKLGKGERTLWRWIKQGCNLRDPKSIREFQVRNEIRQTPMERARRRKRDNEQKAQRSDLVNNNKKDVNEVHPPTNGDLPPAGKRGAASALERLEREEEESYRRLVAVKATDNLIQIQAA